MVQSASVATPAKRVARGVRRAVCSSDGEDLDAQKERKVVRAKQRAIRRLGMQSLPKRAEATDDSLGWP
jgi:chromosome condensin MukBEF MukE localization factor